MLIHSQLVTDLEEVLYEHPNFIDGHDIGDTGNKHSKSGRYSGWHVSGILRNIAVGQGIVDYENNSDGWEHHEEAPDDNIDTAQLRTNTIVVRNKFQLRLNMLMGFQWEEYMVKRVSSVSGTIWRPGQYTIPVLAGKAKEHLVWASPDGYTNEVEWLKGVKIIENGQSITPKSPNIGRVVTCGEEFKSTHKSSRQPISAQWMWLKQIQAYAQPDCLDVLFFRIHVLHVNGRYEKSKLGDPEYWCHWVELTPMELRSMWKMVEGYVGEKLKENRK